MPKKHRFVRLAGSRKQYVFGESTPSIASSLSRLDQLEKTCKSVYRANSNFEKRQYDRFGIVCRLASRRLSYDFELYLHSHGFTHDTKGRLSRMNTSNTSSTVSPASTTDTASPTMTEEELQDLVDRVSANDQEASKKLRRLTKQNPSKWLSGQSLVSIARRELIQCISAQNAVSRVLMEEYVDVEMALLMQTANSAFEKLIVEHIQMNVLAAKYNRLMLIDARRSMRERDSFENRAKKAEVALHANLQKYHELKMFVNSDWTRLPSELPIDDLVNRRSNESEDFYDMVDEADSNMCSMII